MKNIRIIVPLMLMLFPGCGLLSTGDITGLEIYPTQNRIAAGYSREYNLTATFKDFSKEDVTKQANWVSDNPSVAVVEGSGTIKGVSPGSAVIRATHLGLAGTIEVRVTDAKLESLQLTPVRPDMPEGTRRQFTATGIFSDRTSQNLTSQAEWSSDETVIAVVNNLPGEKGIVTVRNPGITRITADVNGVSGSSMINAPWTELERIQVTPFKARSAEGFTVKFRAVGIYKNKMTQDLTDEVRWSSSRKNVAVISNDEGSKGAALAKAGGESVISASLGGVIGSVMLKVTPAVLVSIQVTPINIKKPVGLHQKFEATGIFSDKTHQNITADIFWAVTNPDPEKPVAIISNQQGSEGMARAMRPGTVEVRAVKPGKGAFSSDKEGRTPFTVR